MLHTPGETVCRVRYVTCTCVRTYGDVTCHVCLQMKGETCMPHARAATASRSSPHPISALCSPPVDTAVEQLYPTFMSGASDFIRQRCSNNRAVNTVPFTPIDTTRYYLLSLRLAVNQMMKQRDDIEISM